VRIMEPAERLLYSPKGAADLQCLEGRLSTDLYIQPVMERRTMVKDAGGLRFVGSVTRVGAPLDDRSNEARDAQSAVPQYDGIAAVTSAF
jgi:hypothetical protein